MEKLSKKPFSGVAKKINPTVAGAAIGGTVTGGVGALSQHLSNRKTDKRWEQTNKQRAAKGQSPLPKKQRVSPLAAGAIFGAFGAAHGAAIGNAAHMGQQQGRQYYRGGTRRGPGGYAPPPPPSNVMAPAWAGKVKTKSEATKAWKSEARKHHPDLGGNPDKMKKVNAEWEEWQRSNHFNKLAGVIPSFLDELMQIYS